MTFRPARIFLAAAMLTATLAGCSRAPGLPAAPTAAAPGLEAMAAGGLATRLKRLYGAVFDLYDADSDGRWEPKDFDLPEDRFLNLFHNEDDDDDRLVTRVEFYSKAEHDDEVLYVEARAGVTAQTVGGRVSYDKAFDVLDVYLAPYLNKDLRKKFIKKAFETADADDTGYLKIPELEIAYAILLAKAEEKRVEKAVNRSKGQPDKEMDIDPPSWVKKKHKD